MKTSKAVSFVSVLGILAIGAGCGGGDDGARSTAADAGIAAAAEPVAISEPSNGATVRGLVTVTATPKDNVKIASVKFYVGTNEIASRAAAPWSTTWDTTGLATGSYTVRALVADTDGKTTSPAVTVTVGTPDGGTTGSCGSTTELFGNGGFESGDATWDASGRVITNTDQDGFPARTGSFKAYFGGFGYSNSATLTQKATIPADACKATLSYWVRVLSDEPDSAGEVDTLTVQLRDGSGKVLETLSKLSNRTLSGSYIQKTVDLTPYKGKSVEVRFSGVEDKGSPTSFFVDDVSLSFTR